ncbi:hypothetical protein HSR122_1370 [Halapricum desulfuricans]|uniref:Uncharacterized protein n=1 Tax=Halapricum desulfuricans TaxID=2841257 RepID=A0A897N7S9_9EURY|nr:hypothetical protein HSR122_1370 [Halapricum desulfuricans]
MLSGRSWPPGPSPESEVAVRALDRFRGGEDTHGVGPGIDLAVAVRWIRRN